LEKVNGIRKSKEDILVTAGASGALFLVFQALLNRGDEVLLADPSWPHFAEMIKLSGGTTTGVPFISKDGKEFDAAALENSITGKTKVLLINSPHNPTGAVLSRKNLEEIAKIAEKRKLKVISDEVYEDFVYDLNKHDSIGSFYDNSISVYSFSKTYAMCGWRLGYVGADAHTVELMTKLNLYSITCIPPFIQMAGIAALEGDQSSVQEMVRRYRNRRDILVKGLNEINGIKCPSPNGSIYVWPDVSGLGESRSIAESLVKKSKCVTVPGEVFGANGNGRLRLSLSIDESRINEGLKRIKEAKLYD
jgi:aspartate/methionine/tyrosine aminotransferase